MRFSAGSSSATLVVALASLLLQVLPSAKATFPFSGEAWRSMDGTDRDDNLGAAHSNLKRMAAASYKDGRGDIMDENFNARSITNIISNQDHMVLSSHGLSAMVWQFGQLLDHDIGITEASEESGIAHIPCEDPDDMFKRNGCDHIGFTRSIYTNHDDTNPREHPNDCTSFIDASFTYGSDNDRAHRLRSYEGGKLLSSPGTRINRPMLPYNFPENPLTNAGGNATYFFVSGDIRANEQVGLTAMHTLFLREHNRLCEIIKMEWPDATDEEIYQTARRIVGAEMQKITCAEWLPALMGDDAPGCQTSGSDGDPSMMTEFTSACFRFGHSLLHDSLTLGYNKLSTTSLSLRNAFFNPFFLSENPENVDLILGGLLLDAAQESDVFITPEVRDFLFAMNGRTACLDLAALNIQRGRDHGLPPYNELRVAMGLDAKSTFEEITSNQGLANAMSIAYHNDISKLDLWVGALAEDHLEGSSLGELMTHVFQQQFSGVRDGDPFWFTIDPMFKSEEMKKIIDIDTFSFSKLLMLNTDIPFVRDNVFKMPEDDSKQCGSLGDISVQLTA